MQAQIPILGRFQINSVIKFLTYSDIILLGGWGLIEPIIAVFIIDKIQGGGIEVVGISTTLYLISRSLLQIPIAKWLDEKKGEYDDYTVLIIGRVIGAIAAFLFLATSLPWHIYVVQIINGLSDSMTYPAWTAIFTRHIDKNKEGYEWSLYYTTTDVASALAAALGGFLVLLYGYQTIFIVVGVLSLISTGFLFGIVQNLKKR